MFYCDQFVANAASAHYKRKAFLSRDCSMSHFHWFDIAGELILGDGAWFGGVGSQVWMHGPGIKLRRVVIGDGCYLSAGVQLGPGGTIGSGSLVGMEAVLTTKFPKEGNLIIADKAKQLRTDWSWRTWKPVESADGSLTDEYVSKQGDVVQ